MNNRGKIYLILLGFLPLFCNGQNLVPNSGFENHSTCLELPNNQTLLNCDLWFNAVHPLSTIDWLSSCYPAGSFYEIPNTYYGYSPPHSGESMIGFGPYSQYTGIGESFGIRLTQPLVADSAYCFSFWCKNSRMKNWDYTNYEFDIAFINDTAGVHSTLAVSDFTVIPNNNESNDWNYFSGYYVAQGGEEFLLVGVFTSAPNYYIDEHIPPGEYRYMYYFVDDVSVKHCNKDSLFTVLIDLPNVFTPNGDLTNDSYLIRHNNIKSMEVQILNRWGNLIVSYDGLASSWNGRDANGNLVNEGVYFVNVVAETKFEETLTKHQFIHLYY